MYRPVCSPASLAAVPNLRAPAALDAKASTSTCSALAIQSSDEAPCCHLASSKYTALRGKMGLGKGQEACGSSEVCPDDDMHFPSITTQQAVQRGSVREILTGLIQQLISDTPAFRCLGDKGGV